MRWAAGEEFDTSPKRIKTPACAVRAAMLVCCACACACPAPVSLSPLIISSAIPFHPPLRSLSSPRGRHLYPSLGCSRGGSALSRRERNRWGRQAIGPPPPSTIGCSSVADPGGHRASLPWFSEPGGILALQAKEPVCQWARKAVPFGCLRAPSEFRRAPSASGFVGAIDSSRRSQRKSSGLLRSRLATSFVDGKREQ